MTKKKSIFDKEGHFWFSIKKESMSRKKHKNYAKIKGKVVEYNEWTDDKKPYGRWGDYVYLGKRKFHHTKPTKSKKITI